MTDRKTIILSIAGIILLGIVVGLFFELNLLRWLTCSFPFTTPGEQASEMCKRLEKVP